MPAMQAGISYIVPNGTQQRRATDRIPGARVIPFPSGRRKGERELSRLHLYRTAIAKLVMTNPAYLPIFKRLETEIAIAEAKLASPDPVAQARAIMAARRIHSN